ncbi:MAG: FAD-binding oxidoreductase [Pseudomonadota bacterium]
MQRRQFLRSSAVATLALPSLGMARSLRHVPTPVPGAIDAVTVSGRQVTISQAEVQSFSNSLKSHLVLPGMDGYDDARLLLNPSFDKRPALICQPTGAADVQHAVNFAREHQLLTAVKCGGHSASGKSTCDGGLQIDLSRFHGVRVDPQARTARVDGGSLLGELDHESMAHGLVTTAGTVSHTGVGGLTLGGGFGRLGRRFGMTIDNVLEMDVVTPDGQLRRAAPDENVDLYWALRGGGGNFGVVTSFLFYLHPMQREVIAGRLMFPFEQARQLWSFYGEYAPTLPDEMTLDAAMLKPPGAAPGMMVYSVVWSGPPKELESLLAPIRKAGNVMADTLKPVDYVALQRSGDANDVRANALYQKSGFVSTAGTKLASDLVDNFDPKPHRGTWLATQQCGGAISRIGAEATAFSRRDSLFNVLTFMSWPAQAEAAEHVRDIKAYWAHIEPHTRGFYSNDLYDEDQRGIASSYGENYARLKAIKDRYDPNNLFRLNPNIV